MNFQKITMLVAGILLLILFVMIAISYNHANSKAVWPPIINNCPDYFKDINGDGSSCVNDFNLGINYNGVKEANYTIFKNMSPCDKYTYCNTNLLTWDGITYGYGLNNPCESS
jgi:hypothetical protein